MTNLDRARHNMRGARTSELTRRRTNARQLVEAFRLGAVDPTRQASGWGAQPLTAETLCVHR